MSRPVSQCGTRVRATAGMVQLPATGVKCLEWLQSSRLEIPVLSECLRLVRVHSVTCDKNGERGQAESKGETKCSNRARRSALAGPKTALGGKRATPATEAPSKSPNPKPPGPGALASSLGGNEREGSHSRQFWVKPDRLLAPTTEEQYQIGLGNDWFAGLERWEIVLSGSRQGGGTGHGRLSCTAGSGWWKRNGDGSHAVKAFACGSDSAFAWVIGMRSDIR